MSTEKRERLLSAQVVLGSASGKRADGRARITADSIEEYTPSREALTEVKRFFREAGFDVGDVVGNSFSITASASTFERVFQSKLRYDEGIVRVANREGGETYELPRVALPRSVSEELVAVTFTPPPDFGPTNFDA